MRNPSCCSSSINSESSETFRIIIHQCKIAQRKNFLQVLQRFTIPFFNHALWYPMSAMLHTIPHTFFRNFNRIYTNHFMQGMQRLIKSRFSCSVYSRNQYILFH